MDEIKITILDNGQVKIETGRISGPNHTIAERVLSEITRALGGPVKRVMKIGASLSGALRSHTHDGHTHSH